MSESEFVRSLLIYGVAAIKGNDKQEARSNFNRVLYQIDASVDQKIEAWWWLSQIAEKPEEKRELLQNILQSDPTEPRARRVILLRPLRPPPDSKPTALFVPIVEAGFPTTFRTRKFVAVAVTLRFEIHNPPKSRQSLKSRIFMRTFPRPGAGAGNCRQSGT
jgi:hypothetical protein